MILSSAFRRTVGAVLASAVLAGCGDDESLALDPADQAFAGIDKAIVTEVLENPEAAENIGLSATDGQAQSMAQGIALNFITCRAAGDAYRSWVMTGETPTTVTVPHVEHPIDPGHQAVEDFVQAVNTATASGDPATLRANLSGPGSCGSWIPAEPGDVSGPTIEDTLEDIG